MADWSVPTVTSLYTDWDTGLKARDDSLAKMFDDGVSWSNLPTGTIRWNSSSSRFEKWNGTTWANLSTALTDVLKIANNLSDLASAATARTNLGLGSVAVENTPLDVTKGGTSSTTAAGARAAIGCGTMATQNASAVAITGGSFSGLANSSFASSQTLSFTSNGQIVGVAQLSNSGANLSLTTFGGTSNWLTFGVNNTIMVWLSDTDFGPANDNNVDLGRSSKRWKESYIARGNFGAISSHGAIDLPIQTAATTKWVFGGTSFEFRPNVNGTQDIGATSYRVANAYLNNVLGVNTSIHLSDGSDAHIRYLAGTAGEHRFYNVAGGTELLRIDSDGKLNPIAVTRKDYTSAVSTRRTISTGDTLANVVDCLGTLVSDLIALGLLQ